MDLRHLVNKYLYAKIAQLKTYFKQPRVYAYVIHNKQVVQSGFIFGFWVDKKKRKWVTLQCKNPLFYTQPFQPKYIYIKMPAQSLTHYRECYAKWQLWLAARFGKQLMHKNRKLKKY
jgi:hypothetical protein